MRFLPKPKVGTDVAFLTCVTGILDPSLATRLETAKLAISTAGAQFESLSATADSHLVQQQPTAVTSTVSGDDVRSLYAYQMSKRNGAARYIYDDIKLAAVGGICPYCAQRTVSTLDHYMPQSKYAALATVPINLVPCCADCNKAKLARIPRSRAKQFIHPYFDDVQSDGWLRATVLQSNPPAIKFFVARPSGWPKDKGDRVQFHFDALKLGTLYSTHAAVELTNIRESLLSDHQKAGPIGVRNSLNEAAVSRTTANINSWQAALYVALAADTWFHSVGYSLIPQP